MSHPDTIEDDEVEIRSAADLLPLTWTADLPDYALDLRWSPDGTHLAMLPSTGNPQVFRMSDQSTRELPAHRGGNGSIAWHPDGSSLATFGHDCILRIHCISLNISRELQLPRGWAERCAWNSDGSLIAAAIGKAVHVVNTTTLETLQIIDDHRSTVTDLVWHPVLTNQLATASDGGARMWRLGETKPFARIDDGVAAVLATWSPDGRW